MRRRKWLVVLSLFAVIGLVFPGCGGNKTLSSPATPPVQTLVSEMLKATASLKTYEMSIKMTMSATAFGNTVTTSQALTGKIDLYTKKTYLNQEAKTVQNQVVRFEAYAVGDQAYMKFETPFRGRPDITPGIWYRAPESRLSELLGGLDIGKLTRIMLDGAEVEIQGSEKVDGIDTWKLNITPNKTKFAAYLDAAGLRVDKPFPDPEQGIQNLSATGWVVKNTSHLVKTDLAARWATQYAVMDMTISTTLSRINQPVNITLPTAALEATPLR